MLNTVLHKHCDYGWDPLWALPFKFGVAADWLTPTTHTPIERKCTSVYCPMFLTVWRIIVQLGHVTTLHGVFGLNVPLVCFVKWVPGLMLHLRHLKLLLPMLTLLIKQLVNQLTNWWDARLH